MRTPVLLIHFNRPESTRRQLKLLTAIAPRRVWIVCDGARAEHPGESERVAEVRALLDDLPWRCKVQRLYRTTNMGCFKNISDGLNWFFQDCESGIILEDDVLPDSSFFPYTEELLTRYANRSEVFAIAGHNRRDEPFAIPADYGFSNYFECWGWATWRRAWEQFDPAMQGWQDKATWHSICHRVLSGSRARLYWNWVFRRVAEQRVDSWAYRFMLTIWKERGCVVIPKVNLTENIGFSPGATQTAHLEGTAVPARHFELPLKHPNQIAIDPLIDRWFEDGVHSKSLGVRFNWCVRTVRRGLQRKSAPKPDAVTQ
ncbi:MAG: hypothetical protein ACI81V_001438 [Lentimonas sp.]|jgi:hypothetical protein